MVYCYSRITSLHTYYQKSSYENTKYQVKIQSCIKKVRKEYLQETISLLSLPENSDVLTHMPREVQQEVIFALLQYHLAQHVKNNLELQVVLLMEDELRDDDKM